MSRFATLICVRHGRTRFNAEGRFQGHMEVPLSPLGVAQAEALADALANEPISAVYTSDLARALSTAIPIASRHHLPVRLEPGLREWALGDFQGLTMDEIKARFPEAHARFSDDPEFQVPNGESAREKDRRAVAAALAIAQAHLDQTVVVVSHGGILNAFFQRALGLPVGRPKGYRIANASLNVFEVGEGRFTLVSWGITAHLAAVGGPAATEPTEL